MTFANPTKTPYQCLAPKKLYDILNYLQVLNVKKKLINLLFKRYLKEEASDCKILWEGSRLFQMITGR